MRPCYFCKEPPEVDIRGDHIFIKPSHTDEFEIAITANVLQRTVARYNRILEEWRERQVSRIMPFEAPAQH